ncbi:hypothetical protein BBK36DRAFT_44263, partial [Trichoderma citrinoviride]
IDSLLERYLSLLDEYTRLRQDLSRLQSGVYQNIARANFTGERGMRYGQDHYDERMRAIRVLRIDEAAGGGGGELSGGLPRFTVRNLMASSAAAAADEEADENEKKSERSRNEKQAGKKKQKTEKTSRNPLHWYGLLAPLPLRTAQALSVQAVEQVIPRLVSVNAEMERVEIEIRRARKKRAKAAA